MSDIIQKPPSGGLAAPGDAIDWSRLSDEARATLSEFAYAPNTRRTYKSAWETFVAWCSREGRTPIPASPYDVADHLAYLGGLQPTSVSRVEVSAAAIACAMALAGQPYDRNHEAVRKMLRALRRKIGVAPRHQKQPLVAELLQRVCEPLGDSLIDLRDRAILVVGFLSACRRSNISALDVEDLTFTRQGLDVTLRRSKTDQEGAGYTVSIPLQDDPQLCAVGTLRAWMGAASVEGGALFRSVSRWGRVGGRLGAQEVCRRVQVRIDRAGIKGIDPAGFGAHSLRAGFCTSAAEAGASIDTIMAQTAHRSANTVIGYIRRANRYRNNAASGLLGRKEST